MKQLHIREPWADSAYRSGDQVLEDLLSRVQALEARVRQLEEVAEDGIHAPDPVRELDPMPVREPVTAGV